MKIKRKAKPEKILTIHATSGNSADVFLFQRDGRILPIRVTWDHFPPSAADVEEANVAVAQELGKRGLTDSNPHGHMNLVDNAISTEEAVRRGNKVLSAENN